ncbi:uncharacterized protein LOC123534861 [Mercenaria mercenaria]|uniref:uncharacterized protein LOC123534861 n=1 Tax=Mercenaria mercenaria TaxID=6596 RepID=UPI00234EEFA4|nr:uncharacterized protein LOC123534861 [Mercenaria mercenaria]
MANLIVKHTGEHLNFKCALVALSVTGQALENVTETKLQAVHDTIKRKHGALKPCSQQCSKMQRNIKKWCSTCELWRNELESYVTGQTTSTRINWDKMKSWEWPQHHRNIAEVFTAAGWNTSKLNLKDVSTSLSIWQSCKEFPRHFVQYSKSLQKARNNLFHIHASSLCLTSDEMKSIFRAIYKVLNHGDVIPLIQNYNEVANAIKDLEQGNLHGHEKEASKALKEIAGTNKEILAKINKLEKNTKMNYLLLVFAIISVLLSFIYSLNIRSTDDDKKHLVDLTNRLNQCLPEKSHRLFKPGISMEGYLDRDNQFVGRDWLFHDLAEKIVNVSMGRGVVMVADMGYGKSAIVAHMVCSNESDVSFKLRKRLVAYHICKFDVQLSKRSNTFIKRIASMIAQRSAQFAKLLEKDRACIENYDSDTCEQDPFGCMDQCLIDPLRKVQLNQSDIYIIAIDALDECENNDGDNVIYDLLNSDRMKQIPYIFKFIITSRNITAYYALNADFSFMMLRDNHDLNLKDINSFIYASNHTIVIRNQASSIHNISNFLLASNIMNTPSNFEEGNQIPKSIYRFYGQLFQRLFGKQYDQSKSILEVVCASIFPPTENYVRQITQSSTNITKEQFSAVMEKFQHILAFSGAELHLTHMSLKNWLISKSSGKYELDIKRGHMRHALFLFENLNHDIPVDLVDISIHISYASPRGKLMGMFHRINQSKLNEYKTWSNELPLHRLVKQCDCVEAIQLLHYHFRDVNELNQAGMSPLYLAASLGRTKIFQYLSMHNADIHFRLRSYSNVIHLGLAAEIAFNDRHWGYGVMDIAAQNNHIDIIRDILVKDVTASRYDFLKMNGLNLLPIHLACKVGHKNIVKLIVEYKADMLDDFCLYFASANGNTDVVEFALSQGIKDTCRTCLENFYWVPKNKRRIQGNDLLSDEGYSVKDYVLFDDSHLIMCETALHAAVRENRTALVKVLISQPLNALSCIDRSGRTPLISAIVYNRREIFHQIIRRFRFDVHLKCQHPKYITDISQLSETELSNLQLSMCDSESPVLHIAAKYDRYWVFQEIEQTGVHWTEIPRDSEGCHAVHKAACHGSLRVLDYIKSVEENILHMHCSNGSDPLHAALACGSFEAANFILEKEKRNVIYHRSNASRYMFSAVKVNVSKETANDAEDIVDKSLAFVTKFITNGFLLNVTDQYERNIFHYAISNGHYKLISKLMHITNENDSYLNARDIYGKIPVIYGLENLPVTDTVKLFISANYTQLLHQLSSTLSPQEYSCFITLLHIKNKTLLKEGLLKKIMRLIVRKRRLILFTAISMYIRNDSKLDPALVRYMSVHDNSNIFLWNYISVCISKARAHSSYAKMTKRFVEAVHCVNLKLPCILHEIARFSNLKIIVHTGLSAALNQYIANFVFNKEMPHLLTESLDSDGYNVLERAVQGRNVILVKHFIEMKIKINKKVDDFFLWALFDNSSQSSVTVLKGIKDDLITAEIQNNRMIYAKLLSYNSTSRAHKAKHLDEVLMSDFDILKGHNREMHNQMDEILTILLTENRKNISKEFICSQNSRNFSFVHLVAMQGYIDTLKVISKYWGLNMLKCTTTDKFTPLYLAKVFDNKAIITYLENHQIRTRVPESNAEIHFIFKIWSRFLLNRKHKKKLYCLYQLKRKTFSNINAGLNAFRCIKRSAEALGISDKMKDGLAEFKSILIYVSNVNVFKHHYKIICIIERRLEMHYLREDEYQLHMNSFKYQVNRANASCRIASKALLKTIYHRIKRISKSSYNVRSIGYKKKQVLSKLLTVSGKYFTFDECVLYFSDTTESVCPCFSHYNMIKQSISSPNSRLREVIEKLLSNIVMHTVNFFFKSGYFASRVMLDYMFVSGVWLWDHHLYAYMDVIQNMKFYQDTFMMNEGLLSEHLRLSAEIRKSFNYLEWSKNARELVNQFTNKLKHG